MADRWENADQTPLLVEVMLIDATAMNGRPSCPAAGRSMADMSPGGA